MALRCLLRAEELASRAVSEGAAGAEEGGGVGAVLLQVLRQLRVDLPRSRVRRGERRLLDPQEVMRCTPHARLCTQAVMAPPVEWLIAADLIAYELPSHPPLEVDVLSDGAVRVRKLLGVRNLEGALRENAEIRVDVDGSDVVVTLQAAPHAPNATYVA